MAPLMLAGDLCGCLFRISFAFCDFPNHFRHFNAWQGGKAYKAQKKGKGENEDEEEDEEEGQDSRKRVPS